jgi:hypothetical protein
MSARLAASSIRWAELEFLFWLGLEQGALLKPTFGCSAHLMMG